MSCQAERTTAILGMGRGMGRQRQDLALVLVFWWWTLLLLLPGLQREAGKSREHPGQELKLCREA